MQAKMPLHNIKQQIIHEANPKKRKRTWGGVGRVKSKMLVLSFSFSNVFSYVTFFFWKSHKETKEEKGKTATGEETNKVKLFLREIEQEEEEEMQKE